MFWLIPSLFALCAALMGYVLLRALREAEESYANEYTADTARQFEDLFLFISPRQMLNISRLLAVIIFFLLFIAAGDINSLQGFVSGTFAGGLGGVLALFLPRLLLKILRIRRLERFNSQLVTAMTGMSNALKAGFSIQQAFEAIVKEGENPISQEFAMFLQQLRVGMAFEDALADMDRRMGSDDLTLMIQSIEIARQTGGNLTEVFDRIAETIRERRRIEGKIKSLTAQGKIQGNVVGAMPFILGLAIYFLDPVMMTTFITSGIGLIVIGIVIVMVAMGMLLIRKIVNIDV
ncbi:type II secretion system F family protein [Pontiella sp.]|uniref:type II secretion system F family protein n=1 Tax=Pontiella sp. TaxID=2837462 RepID=UPI00356B3D1E